MRWTEWTLAAEAGHGWAHHGLALVDDATGTRSLVGYHPADPRLLFFDAVTGALTASVACDAVDAHAIVPAGDGLLWLADCGHKLCRAAVADELEFRPPVSEAVGAVLLVDLEGRTRRRIDSIDHPTYRSGGQLLPTGVALDDRGLWIADGYGSNLVHLVSHDGDVLVTIDGLDCPHGIAVDDRRDEPLLYVAERGASRLCVYDLDGRLVRHAATGDVGAPCAIAVAGDRLVVADLRAQVAVLDTEDRVADRIGDDRDGVRRPGWPNVEPERERFTSPHGIAADGDVVYVTEWRFGGRWIRFEL